MGPQEKRILAGFSLGVLAAFGMGLLMVFSRLAIFGSAAHTIPVAFVEQFVADFTTTSLATDTVIVLGIALHLLYGGFWGAFAASMWQPMTPLRGMVLGVFLWVLAAMVVMPYLGMGLFGTDGPAGIVLATAVAHLAYGALYGLVLDWGITVRQSAKHKIGTTA